MWRRLTCLAFALFLLSVCLVSARSPETRTVRGTANHWA